MVLRNDTVAAIGEVERLKKALDHICNALTITCEISGDRGVISYDSESIAGGDGEYWFCDLDHPIMDYLKEKEND